MCAEAGGGLLEPGAKSLVFGRVIAGKGAANPIAMIASFGMALRYSFDRATEADLIDKAIAATLDKGLRTADIKSDGATIVSTREMGDAIIGEMKRLN